MPYEKRFLPQRRERLLNLAAHRPVPGQALLTSVAEVSSAETVLEGSSSAPVIAPTTATSNPPSIL